jgi:hypothetical protein
MAALALALQLIPREREGVHETVHASASTEVVVSVVTFPRSAQAFIDGHPFPTARAVRWPGDGRVHELRVEASGYRAITRRLTLDRDLTMVLELERQRPDELEKTAALTRAPGRPQATAQPERCSPPVPDPQGLSVYRLECL